MSRIAPITTLAVIVAILSGTAANAHPRLVSTDPAAGATTAPSPKEIRLTFNERVIPKFSGVKLEDQSGQLIPTGTAATDSKDNNRLVVSITEQLSPGTYTVEWHAVAEDTHRVQGHYSFSVGR